MMTTTDDPDNGSRMGSGRPRNRDPNGDRNRTPQRQIRVPDTAYYPAIARGKLDGKTIGYITTQLLTRYANGDLDV